MFSLIITAQCRYVCKKIDRWIQTRNLMEIKMGSSKSWRDGDEIVRLEMYRRYMIINFC